VKNGWTAGQYSIFRALFGAYLFVHFAQLAPWAAEVFSRDGVLPEGSLSPILGFFPNILSLCDSPEFVVSLVAMGAGLSLAFAVGLRDRWAAVALWYLWACLLGRNPLIANPSIPYVGWMLLAHACLAPKRRTGDLPWRMTPSIYAVGWILMALGYSYSGYMKLLSPSWQDGTALLSMVGNPLGRGQSVLSGLPPLVFKLAAWGALSMELFFAPLALVRRLRPWLWALLLVMHATLMVLVDFADLSLGMILLHLFTFDPAWLRSRGAPATVLYDGDCGLCHGFVRFVLSEGGDFRFAPGTNRDTIVVRRDDGVELLKSSAVLFVLCRLGGFWWILGRIGGLIPARLRDRVYDAVARVRRRLLPPPDGACPVPSWGFGKHQASSIKH
jgi:predicted DCC family thiol-disulfide oxidoreductase YuxK